MVAEVKNFFDDYEPFRQYLDTLDYEGMVNPADDVFYPGISLEIPQYFRLQVEQKMGTPNYLFLRLSPEGTPCPHIHHTDDLMGNHGMIVYLNRPEHCQGGTSLVTHESGMNESPTTPEETELWIRDHNDTSKWTVDATAEMESNKAVVMPMHKFHRAEPVGGFGDVPRNARLVMVGFFDELKIS